MAEAVVNAKMGMDNKQFMDAAKASTQQMRQVKQESRALAREIGSVNNVAIGLSSIMSGNLSAGFAGLSRGLANIAPKITAMLGPLGLVVAAFTAAYQAGKKLDSLIGVSDAVAKRFGGDTSATDEMARQTAILRERRKGMEEAARIADESAEMAEKRLKGVAKLEADYARERADIERKIADATNADVKAALQSRADMMRTFHEQDVAAAYQAEEDKWQAAQDAEKARAKAAEDASRTRTQRMADENERMRIATLEGLDRIEAEYARRMAEIASEMKAPDITIEQRAILQDRQRLVTEQRDRDIAAIDAQPDTRRQSLLPRRADAMAATGGFLGGERLGLQAPKTAEKLQIENNRILQTNVVAVRDLTAKVEQLSSAMTGGVV